MSADVLQTTNIGPTSYRNWKAQLAGTRVYGASEVPIYSDAALTGEIRSGLGPYELRNGLPASLIDPAAVLTIVSHLDPSQLPAMDKTNTASFTGAWLGDEIAALVSLACGARVMAGAPTRYLQSDGKTWILMGDRMRPTLSPRTNGRGLVLPRAVEEKPLEPDLLATFAALEPEAATVVVRAARSYRDALWIAEAEPDLAWLLLVSALEVAAVQQQIENTPPLDIMRASKPKLIARLEAVGGGLAEEVANGLARELRATVRFLGFMDRFMPRPPDRRPAFGALCIDWSTEGLRRTMTKVYELRSLALHEGIPFPPPMCQAPPAVQLAEAPAEVMLGLSSSTTGGVWTRRDAPLLLHTFEYIARGALLKWWAALPRAVPTAPGLEPPARADPT